jgi:hypothetical protein
MNSIPLAKLTNPRYLCILPRDCIKYVTIGYRVKYMSKPKE